MTAVEAYIEARRHEGRLLPDEIVHDLPLSGPLTAYPEEWQVRHRSMRRVLRMLSERPRRIIEIGCGNGWLSARLALGGHQVIGLDTNSFELAQARRVFAHSRITWVQGGPWSETLPVRSSDLVLFAASVQYFPDLTALVTRCRELLTPHGEILIVDSPFYRNEATAARARERSALHYGSIGVPQMAGHYHHHTLEALLIAASGARIQITPPRGKMAAFFAGARPFPIVQIRF